MFVVVNELFVSPENRATFERNFPASMTGTLPGACPAFARRVSCTPTRPAEDTSRSWNSPTRQRTSPTAPPIHSVPRIAGPTTLPSRTADCPPTRSAPR